MKYIRLFTEHKETPADAKEEHFKDLPSDRIDKDKPHDDVKPAGKYEVLKTHVNTAWKVFNDMITKSGVKVELTEDKFKEHYTNLQKILQNSGKGYQRGQMPRISSLNAWWMQHFLKNGMLDIKPPYDTVIKTFNPLDKNPNIDNPFPTGLSEKNITEIISKFRRKTNDNKDIINSNIQKIVLNKLKPAQSQIFLDKAIEKIIEDGGEQGQIKKLQNKNDTILLTSSDYYIVDGHHRWCSGMLLKPQHIQVHVAVIGLDFETLRGLSIKYMALAKNKPND